MRPGKGENKNFPVSIWNCIATGEASKWRETGHEVHLQQGSTWLNLAGSIGIRWNCKLQQVSDFKMCLGAYRHFLGCLWHLQLQHTFHNLWPTWFRNKNSCSCKNYHAWLLAEDRRVEISAKASKRVSEATLNETSINSCLWAIAAKRLSLRDHSFVRKLFATVIYNTACYRGHNDVSSHSALDLQVQGITQREAGNWQMI